MYKKVLLIVALCATVWAMMPADGMALCRVRVGIPCCTDPLINTLLTGVGNPDDNDIAVCVSLAFDCEGKCYNPANNAETAQGIPFHPQITLCGSEFVEVGDLTGERGTALVGIQFTWDNIFTEIHNWIDLNVSEACKKQWNFVDSSLSITAVYMYHAAYQVTSKGNLYTSSELCNFCVVKPGTYIKQDPVTGVVTVDTECNLVCSQVSTGTCKERSLDTQCWNKVDPMFR